GRSRYSALPYTTLFRSDLVQNHMTFCLFAHTGIFPKELWPRGFGVNGWVRLAGRKMSKSRGNVWYIREAVREWGADAIRLTIERAEEHTSELQSREDVV